MRGEAVRDLDQRGGWRHRASAFSRRIAYALAVVLHLRDGVVSRRAPGGRPRDDHDRATRDGSDPADHRVGLCRRPGAGRRYSAAGARAVRRVRPGLARVRRTSGYRATGPGDTRATSGCRVATPFLPRRRTCGSRPTGRRRSAATSGSAVTGASAEARSPARPTWAISRGRRSPSRPDLRCFGAAPALPASGVMSRFAVKYFLGCRLLSRSRSW